jgi:signal transduction histidine kinase
VKHGHAGKASIEIRREGADIEVTISDNGCGFDMEAPARRGLGLTSIAERVRMLGGVHTLASTPGKGTTLSIRIPGQTLAKGATNGF